jgi:hypothetical protein
VDRKICAALPWFFSLPHHFATRTLAASFVPREALMSNSDRSPLPAKPIQPLQRPIATTAPDPADLGTAYGMEMSIDNSTVRAEVDVDLDDPLGWIRRWVERHKTV